MPEGHLLAFSVSTSWIEKGFEHDLYFVPGRKISGWQKVDRALDQSLYRPRFFTRALALLASQWWWLLPHLPPQSKYLHRGESMQPTWVWCQRAVRGKPHGEEVRPRERVEEIPALASGCPALPRCHTFCPAPLQTNPASAHLSEMQCITPPWPGGPVLHSQLAVWPLPTCNIPHQPSCWSINMICKIPHGNIFPSIKAFAHLLNFPSHVFPSRCSYSRLQLPSQFAASP